MDRLGGDDQRVATTPVYGIPYQDLSDPPDGPALGAGIATSVEGELGRIDGAAVTLAGRVSSLEHGPNVEGWSMFSPGESTSSTSFTNLGAGNAVTFAKLTNSSRLLVSMKATFFCSSSTRGVDFGVQIGGVDYVVAPYHPATPSATFRLVAAGDRLISGVGGTFTVQGRWRASGGSGTVSRNNDDYISCMITEVQA